MKETVGQAMSRGTGVLAAGMKSVPSSEDGPVGKGERERVIFRKKNRAIK